jgi:hypothetical protein
MTTQMSPLFQVMSLPVSTLAANEMAARASMNAPAPTPRLRRRRQNAMRSPRTCLAGSPG